MANELTTDTARHCASCGAVIPPDPRVGLRLLEYFVDALRARFLGNRILKVIPGGARSFTHTEAEREILSLKREAGVDLL